MAYWKVSSDHFELLFYPRLAIQTNITRWNYLFSLAVEITSFFLTRLELQRLISGHTHVTLLHFLTLFALCPYAIRLWVGIRHPENHVLDFSCAWNFQAHFLESSTFHVYSKYMYFTQGTCTKRFQAQCKMHLIQEPGFLGGHSH